jgi:hemerythrin superfamily protein
MSEVTDLGNVRSEVASKMLEKARQSKPQDAMDLLKADHDEAEELYDKFFDAESGTEKQLLVAKLCLALSVHMRIEEDIFYPAVNAAFSGEDDQDDRQEDSLIVPEARVEHASLKKLITEVESAADDVECKARVQVMCEYTKHHVKEEEHKMFSRAKKCDVDMQELGEQLARRKLELLEEMSEEGAGEGSALPSSLFRPAQDTLQTRL